jgi:hypothetical protein
MLTLAEMQAGSYEKVTFSTYPMQFAELADPTPQSDFSPRSVHMEVHFRCNMTVFTNYQFKWLNRV